MSDHVLKASIRQTLTYIEAYDVDLLRAIEASFKEALHNCNDEDEDEDEDEDDNATPKEQATPVPAQEPQPTPQPAPHLPRPTNSSHATASATTELFELPDWHYRLPFIAAISITVVLLILAR